MTKELNIENKENISNYDDKRQESNNQVDFRSLYLGREKRPW